MNPTCPPKKGPPARGREKNKPPNTVLKDSAPPPKWGLGLPFGAKMCVPPEKKSPRPQSHPKQPPPPGRIGKMEIFTIAAPPPPCKRPSFLFQSANGKIFPFFRPPKPRPTRAPPPPPPPPAPPRKDRKGHGRGPRGTGKPRAQFPHGFRFPNGKIHPPLPVGTKIRFLTGKGPPPPPPPLFGFRPPPCVLKCQRSQKKKPPRPPEKKGFLWGPRCGAQRGARPGGRAPLPPPFGGFFFFVFKAPPGNNRPPPGKKNLPVPQFPNVNSGPPIAPGGGGISAPPPGPPHFGKKPDLKGPPPTPPGMSAQHLGSFSPAPRAPPDPPPPNSPGGAPSPPMPSRTPRPPLMPVSQAPTENRPGPPKKGF